MRCGKKPSLPHNWDAPQVNLHLHYNVLEATMLHLLSALPAIPPSLNSQHTLASFPFLKTALVPLTSECFLMQSIPSVSNSLPSSDHHPVPS